MEITISLEKFFAYTTVVARWNVIQQLCVARKFFDPGFSLRDAYDYREKAIRANEGE